MDKQDETLAINPEQIYRAIRDSIVAAQHSVTKAVNSAMMTTYWEIEEQIYKACGENDRAEYGTRPLEHLSTELTTEFRKGFSVQELRNMRQFCCTFLAHSTLWSELNWSHYRLLMRVSDEKACAFYTKECAKSAWSIRQLERQVNAMYYQWILTSQDKAPVAMEVQRREPKPEYKKIVRDPYVMEFLQIQSGTHVHENDLEQALIDHLRQFLPELDRGFSFAPRQKRFTLDGQSSFIDLVFCNYILKCFVLTDLKVDTLTHQDIGQVRVYMNCYTHEMMNEGDNPPVGIVLCAGKNDAVIRYTLPENNAQISTSKYKTYLPMEGKLRRELRLDPFRKLNKRLKLGLGLIQAPLAHPQFLMVIYLMS